MTRRDTQRLLRWLILCTLILAFLLGLTMGLAAASKAASPGWSISSVAAPTTFATADNSVCNAEGEGVPQVPSCDEYEITATNTGKLETTGEQTLFDMLP